MDKYKPDEIVEGWMYEKPNGVPEIINRKVYTI
jgi:hypothetical protein